MKKRHTLLSESCDSPAHMYMYTHTSLHTCTCTHPHTHSLTYPHIPSHSHTLTHTKSGGIPADLSEMLEGIDLNSEDGEEGLMRAMQGMMSTLLSKEVLYPSLKDLCEQYPKWLDSHRDKLPPEEVTRYSKQLDIMISVCKEFEKEGKEEGERVKQARSQRILELMQQVRKWGSCIGSFSQWHNQGQSCPICSGLTEVQGVNQFHMLHYREYWN